MKRESADCAAAGDTEENYRLSDRLRGEKSLKFGRRRAAEKIGMANRRAVLNRARCCKLRYMERRTGSITREDMQRRVHGHAKWAVILHILTVMLRDTQGFMRVGYLRYASNDEDDQA